MEKPTVNWRELAVGVELDRLVAERVGWRVLQEPCMPESGYKSYRYLLYRPDGDWVDSIDVFDDQEDEDAISVLWEDAREVRFSVNLNVAWDLIRHSEISNFALRLDVRSTKSNVSIETIAVARIFDPVWQQGEVVDFVTYEGIAPATEPALAVVRAWLHWHESRATPVLEAVA